MAIHSIKTLASDDVVGTPGDDRLVGTSRTRNILAGDGADQVDGGSGSETLSGGGGADRIRGGNGNDVIYGFGAEDSDPRSGEIRATLIASQLPPVVFLESPPGAPDLLFVATLPGLVFVIDMSGPQPVRLPAPALVLPPVPGQQLLGIAFHPDYAENGRIFLHQTLGSGNQVIVEYHALDADTIDPASREVLLTIPYQAGEMTRGGWLGFGPDGLLYITTGDGGGENVPDPTMAGIAQNPLSLRGKVLRIDVDSPPDPGLAYAIPDANPFTNGGGAPEIIALGMRNPFRASFDEEGNLIVVDVGERFREELNLIPAGATEAINFGWPRLEGEVLFDANIILGPGVPTGPILQFEPGFGPLQGRSIVGGHVYDGPGGAQGLYFFSDFVAPRLFTTRIVDGEALEFTNRNEQLVVQGGDIGFGDVISMSVDGRGRLYTTELDGEIHLLTPSAAAGDGADELHGGNGNDELYGGAGNDSLFGDNGNDCVSGGIGNDLIEGGGGNDVLSGDSGNDSLSGGNGNDRIDGGAGNDMLEGGNGNDTFVFRDLGGTDSIADFKKQDEIDLSAIDAVAGNQGHDAFAFIGADPFSANGTGGELRSYEQGGVRLLAGDVNGDGAADFTIATGSVAIVQSDIVFG